MFRQQVALLLGGLFLLGSCGLNTADNEGDECMVKENLPGICRASSACEHFVDGYIRSGILSINDVRSCGFSSREELVCCPTKLWSPNDPISKPPAPSPALAPSTTSPYDTITEQSPTDTMSRARPAVSKAPVTRVGEPTERPSLVACRKIRSERMQNRLVPNILMGTPVNDGVYPYMVAIATSSFGSKPAFSCGGSLISSRFVLSAAHCFRNTEVPTFVRLGTVNLVNPTKRYQDIGVRNFSTHPDYVPRRKYNDIALLELEREANIAAHSNIYPVCLHTDPWDLPVSSKLFVAGWGVTNVHNRSLSDVLLRAPLDLVPRDKCNESYAVHPTAIYSLNRGVIDSLICAGDTKQHKADSCQGDSGGPLILNIHGEENQYAIVGIISSGFGCATNTPALYTRVASFLDYIESIVWPENVLGTGI